MNRVARVHDVGGVLQRRPGRADAEPVRAVVAAVLDEVVGGLDRRRQEQREHDDKAVAGVEHAASRELLDQASSSCKRGAWPGEHEFPGDAVFAAAGSCRIGGREWTRCAVSRHVCYANRSGDAAHKS